MAGPFLFGNSPPFYSVYGPASATSPGFLTGPGVAQVVGGGLRTWVTTHTDGAAEAMAVWRLDEDTTSEIRFGNGTSANATLAPRITGTQSGANLALQIVGAGTTDTGTSAVLVFDARRASGAAITTRPLFEWDNFGTSYMQMSATGGVKITGGSGSSLQIGSSGTAITQTKVYSQTITPASVAANTTAEQDFTVTGLTTADKVTFQTGAAPTAGTGIVGWRVKSADTLSVTYSNNTAGALTPVSSTCLILATRS